MTSKDQAFREHISACETQVSCLSCGNTTPVLLRLDVDGRPPIRGTCPKCSNTAYTMTMKGLFAFMAAAAREIAQIKHDMLDLQDDGEER